MELLPREGVGADSLALAEWPAANVVTALGDVVGELGELGIGDLKRIRGGEGEDGENCDGELHGDELLRCNGLRGGT